MEAQRASTEDGLKAGGTGLKPRAERSSNIHVFYVLECLTQAAILTGCSIFERFGYGIRLK